MKFVVAFLAIIAIGYVSAKPAADPGGLLGGLLGGVLGGVGNLLKNLLRLVDSALGKLVGIIQSLLNALDKIDTETLNVIRDAVNGLWGNIVPLIEDLPSLNHLDSAVGTLTGNNVVSIVGIIKVAIGDVKSIIEGVTGKIGELDNNDVLFNDFLCNVIQLLSTASASLTSALHPPNINFGNIETNFGSIIQFLADAIAEIQSSISSGNGIVLVSVFGQAGVYVTAIVQQLTTYAGNIRNNGTPGLLNLERFLTSFLAALNINTLGLTCPN